MTNNNFEASWHELALCMSIAVQRYFFNCISLAQSCNFTNVVQFGCANHCILGVSFASNSTNATNVCAEMTNRNSRTKQVDKLLSQKINYNSVHPNTRLYRFGESCDCLVYFCLHSHCAN